MIDEAIRIEADLAKREALTEREHASALVLGSDGEYAAAVEALRTLSHKRAEVDEKRKTATRPLDEAKKTIMEWWRPAMDNLDGAISALRKAIGAYDAKREERVKVEAARIAADLIAGRDMTPVAVSAPEVSYRSDWVYEVIDLDAVPREYLCLDDKKVALIVRALKDTTKIPGIKAVERRTLVQR